MKKIGGTILIGDRVNRQSQIEAEGVEEVRQY